MVLGLIILAFWVGTPLCIGALVLFYWWKKQRPGFIFWIINPLVGAVWLFSIILGVIGSRLAANSTSQTTSTNPVAPASSTRTLHLPGWDTNADGNTWLNESEADKQNFCASSAIASSNHHTAAFFYTNVNATYDPANADGLKLPMIALFLKLDSISPETSYPSLQGFSWKRMNLVHTAKGDVQMIAVFWPDGHTFIHSQGIKDDGSYTMAGPDGPWDGDLYTDSATTTISGNTFAIRTLGSKPSTQSGTYQVSADKQELDLTEDGRPPARYTKAAELVNNIDDLFPSAPASGQ